MFLSQRYISLMNASEIGNVIFSHFTTLANDLIGRASLPHFRFMLNCFKRIFPRGFHAGCKNWDRDEQLC